MHIFYKKTFPQGFLTFSSRTTIWSTSSLYVLIANVIELLQVCIILHILLIHTPIKFIYKQ